MYKNIRLNFSLFNYICQIQRIWSTLFHVTIVPARTRLRITKCGCINYLARIYLGVCTNRGECKNHLKRTNKLIRIHKQLLSCDLVASIPLNELKGSEERGQAAMKERKQYMSTNYQAWRNAAQS
jgi:hypothetical protein